MPYTTCRYECEKIVKEVPYTTVRIAKGAYVDGEGKGHKRPGSDSEGSKATTKGKMKGASKAWPFVEGSHWDESYTTCHTRMEREMLTKTVPCVTWTTQVEEKTKMVPHVTCKMVPYTVTRKVPYTVCEMVEETKVKKICKTTCTMEPVTVCRKVKETVCKMVPVEVRCKVPYTVTEEVAVTITRRVPVCVEKEVCVRRLSWVENGCKPCLIDKFLSHRLACPPMDFGPKAQDPKGQAPKAQDPKGQAPGKGDSKGKDAF